MGIAHATNKAKPIKTRKTRNRCYWVNLLSSKYWWSWMKVYSVCDTEREKERKIQFPYLLKFHSLLTLVHLTFSMHLWTWCHLILWIIQIIYWVCRKVDVFWQTSESLFEREIFLKSWNLRKSHWNWSNFCKYLPNNIRNYEISNTNRHWVLIVCNLYLQITQLLNPTSSWLTQKHKHHVHAPLCFFTCFFFFWRNVVG